MDRVKDLPGPDPSTSATGVGYSLPRLDPESHPETAVPTTRKMVWCDGEIVNNSRTTKLHDPPLFSWVLGTGARRDPTISLLPVRTHRPPSRPEDRGTRRSQTFRGSPKRPLHVRVPEEDQGPFTRGVRGLSGRGNRNIPVQTRCVEKTCVDTRASGVYPG